MKKQEKLYFSPRYRFCDLDLNDPAMMVAAFVDRVEGFYLSPARTLIEQDTGFAAGLLCCAAIDFISAYDYEVRPKAEDENKKRLVLWLQRHISQFCDAFPSPGMPQSSATLADRFYSDFRNGLVHSGVVRNLGQFTLDATQLIALTLIPCVGVAMAVSARCLLDCVCAEFCLFAARLDSDREACSYLLKELRTTFEKEIAIAGGTT